MKKLKIFWFLLIPLAWFTSFKFIIWLDKYPVNWEQPTGIAVFITLSEFFGTILMILGSIAIAIYLQDD